MEVKVVSGLNLVQGVFNDVVSVDNQSDGVIQEADPLLL